MLFVPHILICVAFFFPRVFRRFYVPNALDVFVKVGFRPAVAWMAVAGILEIILAIGLIFAIYTPYSAIAAALYLSVISAIVFYVSGGKWFWNTGGCEYPVVWAICNLLVAIHG
jgi:putative oxidoreductase